MGMEVVLASILFLIIGAGVGFVVRNAQATKETNERKAKGDEIIEEAKEKAKDIAYKARKEAKEIAKEEKENFEKECEKRLNDIRGQEKGLITKETKLETKIEEHDRMIKKLESKEDELKESKLLVEAEIERFKRKQSEVADRLSEVASMSRDDAKQELMSIMEEEAKVDDLKDQLDS